MEQDYEYESSIGGSGDPANDHRWNNGIGQFSYPATERPQFSQSNAAYEGKKFYSENFRKYEDAVRSGVNLKPSNENVDAATFRTSNSNECHTMDNLTSKSSPPPNDDHSGTNNNPIELTSAKDNHQKQKRTSKKPETNPTKNKTVFFDPKRIFADMNKGSTSDTDEHDTSDTQSDDELIDLREQSLRFDAEMKRKFGATAFTPNQESGSPKNTKDSPSPKKQNKSDNIEEKISPDKLNEKCASPKTNLTENITNDVTSTNERNDEDEQKASSKTFKLEEERTTKEEDCGGDQNPTLSSWDSTARAEEPGRSKPADSEGYSRQQRKPRTKTTNHQQSMPDNTSRSAGAGRSRIPTNTGRNQEAHWSSQMRMDDERRDVNVEDEGVREEVAADGSGDALQQLLFGIIKVLVWFLGFLFFIFLVLLSFTLNIAKRWFVYTVVFLKLIVGWIRYKCGLPPNSKQNGGVPSMEDIQRLLNLGPSENILLPTKGEKAVERLLTCNSEDPYEILGVTCNATDDEIKRYYRKQCIMVHPDKNTMDGAEEAFKILGSAFEIIGEPTKRAEFHRAITEYAQKEMFHKEFTEQFKKMKEAFEERENTIHCLVCRGNHLRFLTDRPPYAARYCVKHDTRHTATDGDIWAESTHFGFRWHYFTCTGNKVYDVTEWAKCQDMGQMMSNAHEVRYRFDTRRQHRQRPAPPPNFNEEEFLEELLRQAQNMNMNQERSTRHQNTNANTHQRKHKRKHKKKKGF